MKNFLILTVTLLAFISCGNRTNNEKAADNANANTIAQTVDPSNVYVYYFHGKQRCKSCIAVEKTAKETIEKTYVDNKGVRFIEIDTRDKKYEKLVEKYQITWNALIITKGEDHTDITQQAFANAVDSPEILSELIRTEVNRRLVE